MFVWKIEFVYNTNRDAQKSINVIASSFTDAVTTAQINLPNAEITGVHKLGTYINVNDSSWLDTFAKFLVDRCLMSDLEQICAQVGEDKRKQLTAAVFKAYHIGGNGR